MLSSESNRPRPRFNLLLCIIGIVFMLGGFGLAGLFGIGQPDLLRQQRTALDTAMGAVANQS